MRVADYIAQQLADWGVQQVFMLTGGGAMFLNDAIGNHPNIKVIFNHHEQACAMAAEGYARITNKIGVLNVTTGPGGINALNGVYGAWVDSIPMLVISGQVKRETCMSNYGLVNTLRQLGDQEVDIISMVTGITKYAVQVNEPTSIRYHLERAWHLAQSGRPGPCWLDIPIDVTSTKVNLDELQAYDPSEDTQIYVSNLQEICNLVIEKINISKRPVIMAGKGIRLGNAIKEFETWTDSLDIPVVPAWTALDLVASNDRLFGGRAGDLATRSGNFTVQNSDLLLVLGCRLGLRQISLNWDSFARFAYKIQVDIDANEFEKPFPRIDMPIHQDVKTFLIEMIKQMTTLKKKNHQSWLSWCQERVERYPAVLPKHRQTINEEVNPYNFIDILFSHLNYNDVIICGDGTANVVTFQAAKLQKGQRLIANTGAASMGYDLPAAIGAACARKGERVICLAGDGSLQLNIQELQTISHHRLPIKLFVLNNNGYLSIRASQQNMFGRLTGEGRGSGVSFPDIVKVAQAYGIPATRVDNTNINSKIVEALIKPGPVVCDVLLSPTQTFEPRVSAKQLPDGRIVSSNLEDMSPFLPEDELKENMIAFLDTEAK